MYMHYTVYCTIVYTSNSNILHSAYTAFFFFFFFQTLYDTKHFSPEFRIIECTYNPEKIFLKSPYFFLLILI